MTFHYHPDPDDIPDDVRADAAEARRNASYRCAECGGGRTSHNPGCPNDETVED